jgi:hypothetical protein
MRVIAVLAALVAATVTPIEASAKEHPKLVVVLDASGSMWGHLLDDQPKIAAAKQVVRDLLADWDPNVHLGVTVYGHRQKGACDDIEAIVPVGPVASAELLRRVDAIQPKGKTPMTEAVRRAAAELKYTEERAAVILVSDGEETCDADPCAAATALEQSGVDLTVHTIGFDVVEEKGREQLRCLAENTGGRFLLASDGASLKKAIEEAVTVAVAPPPAEPAPTEAPTEAPTVAPTAAEVPPTPEAQPTAKPVTRTILPRGGPTSGDAVALSPGEYFTNWEIDRNVYEHWTFEARAGQLVTVDLLVTPDKGYTGGVLTDATGNDLVRESCRNSAQTIAWLGNGKEETRRFVFALGGCNGIAEGSGVRLSIEDAYDADTTADAGDEFDAALEISAGRLQGVLAAPHAGDDVRDYYRIPSLGTGRELKLKAVPPTDVGYRLTIFDQDRVRQAQKASANRGAVVRVGWTPKEDQEEVFVLVEQTGAPNDAKSVPYTVEVSVGGE